MNLEPAQPISTVLVVEDEPVLLSSMVRGLSKLPGVQVLGAPSLQEAFRLLREHKPRVVLSDIDLPDGSGIELVSERDRLALATPIVFVTAYLGLFRSEIPMRPNVEVREKPLSLEALRSIVRERLTWEHQEESPFGMADFIQLACMGGHSVIITIELPGQQPGQVLINRGELWSAEDEHSAGTAAFRGLAIKSMALKGAKVDCRTLRGVPGPRTIEEGWQGLLLEAAQALDEQGPNKALRNAEEPAKALQNPEPPQPPQPPQPQMSLDELMDEGLNALLKKDYAKAYELFVAANKVRPGISLVTTNLKRLHDLGFGQDGKP